MLYKKRKVLTGCEVQGEGCFFGAKKNPRGRVGVRWLLGFLAFDLAQLFPDCVVLLFLSFK